jgi:alpha-N-arabinofuranosidase
MRSAVAAGLGLNIFNRQADRLYMSNIAQMVNVLQAVLITDGPEGRNCVRTTSYYAFLLFKPHRAKMSVRLETDAAPQPTLPDLSMSASRQGSELVVTLVNPRHDAGMQVDCEIRGATPRQGRADILHDPDINAYNSFENQNRVVIRPHPVAVENGRIRIALPAMSVATVTVTAG